MAAIVPDEGLTWRERREQRRQKQREGNVGRAEKMHRARLEQPLPFNGQNAIHTDTHIGCSGWFYWDWRKKFYPAGMPTSEWFDHYASRFKTVELNAPFYSWPTVAAVRNWVRQVGRRRFIYTVNVCELITHVKRFDDTHRLIEDFGYIADLLGPKMGCFLFQMPPSFRYEPAHLKNILSQLDHRRRNVVEFRHASWWNETVYSAFRETGTIFCSCSAPRLPDDLIRTADDIYVRFHGTQKWYRHDYSKAELDVWAQRIRDSGAKQSWSYFNNDYDAYAIKNARALTRLLAKPASSP
jgi:uncharacterized protein YecE (DUF72 family)